MEKNKKISSEYIIILKLPDGVNFYCGKTKIDGYLLDTWDTDIRYALLYKSKLQAKRICSNLKKSKGQEGSKVKDFQRFKHFLNKKPIINLHSTNK